MSSITDERGGWAQGKAGRTSLWFPLLQGSAGFFMGWNSLEDFLEGE